MLKNEMWKIFEASGNINAYLFYKECIRKEKSNKRYKSEERMLQGI